MKTRFLRNSLLFLAVAAISTAQQNPIAPRPVAKASYAKHHNKLYVYGGREIQENPRPLSPLETGLGQFFVLDLSKPWKSALPAWSRLPDGPMMPNAGAVVSQDGKIFMAIANNVHSRGQQFIFAQNSWKNHSDFYNWNEQSPVVTKTDGSVLAQVGTLGPLREQQQNITRFYSFESESSRHESFPDPTTRSAYFPSRKHKAVWSDYLESAVFHGGFNIHVREIQQGGIGTLRLYRPRSKEWTWK
ncbi:hypothetical protein DFQ26_000298, partial [Actinomortierella ambigua]